MQLITRKALGWPASAAPSQATTRGVKVHWAGDAVSAALAKDHARCLSLWRGIREAHLANPRENYSDVAYNYAACVHGYVLEGRGVGRRTGANGNQTLNKAHYAVLALIGEEGLSKPTDELLHALRDAIEHLQKHGAGKEIRGHKDGYPTECPGPDLYAWVKKGAPRPGGSPKPPQYEPFPGASFFMRGGKPALGKVSPIFTAMGKRLVAVGCGRYKVGPGPTLGQADVDSYEAFQRQCGFRGADAKWPPGPTTWNKLRIPNV